jgi:arylsulfatase A-like enzyme
MLPAVLRQTGYHTAIVGKWHLGLTAPDTPLDRGFDHFRGFLGDMMDDYYTHLRHGQNYLRSGRQVIEPKGHATDLFTAWAVDYLRSREGKSAPFFLYLAYNAPHDPIQPPAEWIEKVRQREPGMSAKRLPLAALIEHLDHGIGEVLSALESTGLAEKTLVLMTSDNGGVLAYDANNGPYRGAKQDLYEGGIRVPLIAAWPGRIAPGTESARVGLTMDLYATICEAAGVPLDRRVDGVSLLPALLGKEGVAPTRDLFWMRREGGARYRGQDYYAVRRGPWKLLHNSPFEPMQLFHLGDDPRETTDRSASEPELVRDLTATLQLHLQRAGAVPWQRPPDRPRSRARRSRP